MIRIIPATLFLGLATLISTGQDKDLLKYVNPFIGTDSMGHTYPGATVPFGMVQLHPIRIPYHMRLTANTIRKFINTVPDTSTGQHHSRFFSYPLQRHRSLGPRRHTADAGNGSLQLNPGTADAPEKGYRSAFSHSTEKASPGYYAVTLEDHDILPS